MIVIKSYRIFYGVTNTLLMFLDVLCILPLIIDVEKVRGD